MLWQKDSSGSRIAKKTRSTMQKPLARFVQLAGNINDSRGPRYTYTATFDVAKRIE